MTRRASLTPKNVVLLYNFFFFFIKNQFKSIFTRENSSSNFPRNPSINYLTLLTALYSSNLRKTRQSYTRRLVATTPRLLQISDTSRCHASIPATFAKITHLAPVTRPCPVQALRHYSAPDGIILDKKELFSRVICIVGV